MKHKNLLKLLTKSGHLNIAEARTELRWMVESIIRQRTKPRIIQKLNSRVPTDEIKLEQTYNLYEFELRKLSRWVHDRGLRDKPLQFILQNSVFCGLEFAVRSPLLIPRWETEEWTLDLIELIKENNVKKISIIDICCGTGCIGLSMYHHLTASGITVDLTMTDINPYAILMSRFNQKKVIKSPTVPASINYIASDIMSEKSDIAPLIDTCDLIVSNPPYIPASEYKSLHGSVLSWEDRGALVGDSDFGIKFHLKLLEMSYPKTENKMPPSVPRLVMEINGNEQAEILKKQCESTNYSIKRDFSGNSRTLNIF